MWSGGRVARPGSCAWRAGSRRPRCSRCSRWRARSRPPRGSFDPAAAEDARSTPRSPNSLISSARRLPPAFSTRWRTRLVLPAPRKPVTIVAGILVSSSLRMRAPARGEGSDRRPGPAGSVAQEVSRRSPAWSATRSRAAPAAGPRHWQGPAWRQRHQPRARWRDRRGRPRASRKASISPSGSGSSRPCASTGMATAPGADIGAGAIGVER